MATNSVSPGIIAEAAKGDPSFGNVSVGTTATLILAANTKRRSWSVFNNDASATLFVGYTSSVTVNNGWPITSKTSWGESRTESAIYGIVASGTLDSRYVEISGV